MLCILKKLFHENMTPPLSPALSAKEDPLTESKGIETPQENAISVQTLASGIPRGEAEEPVAEDLASEREPDIPPPPSFVQYGEKTITLHDIEESIREHFKKDPDKAKLQANLGHSLRYLYALKYIIEHNMEQGRIFEAGGKGVFTHIMKTCLGNIDIFSYEADLRRPIPMAEGLFDTILFMEVIEHITDEKNYHEMRFEGVKTCMQSFFKILKPGGKLFLTTPNAVSCLSLHHLLYGNHPMIYPIHVREYSLKEIQDIAELIGFSTQIITTETLFTDYETKKTALTILKNNGFSTENRGDDIVGIFIKPSDMKPNDPDMVKELYFY